MTDSRTKLKDVKLNDVIRPTLGDEWRIVGMIERPTPKFVRLLDVHGRQLAYGNEGATIWVKSKS